MHCNNSSRNFSSQNYQNVLKSEAMTRLGRKYTTSSKIQKNDIISQIALEIDEVFNSDTTNIEIKIVLNFKSIKLRIYLIELCYTQRTCLKSFD